MLTLDDIKQQYARENNFCEWSEILYSIDDPAEIDEHFDKVANLYALEACKEALKNAVRSSESAARKERSMSRVYLKMYEAIESETNIPQELKNTISNNG